MHTSRAVPACAFQDASGYQVSPETLLSWGSNCRRESIYIGGDTSALCNPSEGVTWHKQGTANCDSGACRHVNSVSTLRPFVAAVTEAEGARATCLIDADATPEDENHCLTFHNPIMLALVEDMVRYMAAAD